MKKYLAIYTGSPNSSSSNQWNALDEKSKKEKEQAGMQAWQTWAKENAKAIVDHGAPLGKTMLANASGISNIKNMMAAYTVVQAESHEAAAKLFKNHPHFTIFPGDGVEIMECLPMPGM